MFVLASNSRRFSLLLFLVWGTGILLSIQAFRESEQWKQTAQMGFNQSVSWGLQKTEATNKQADVNLWQAESRRLIDEDFEIISDSWKAIEESTSRSNVMVDNLVSVIRRNLSRMCSRIDTCMTDETLSKKNGYRCCTDQCCASDSLRRSSSLSQYLVHFQNEIEKRKVYRSYYEESRSQWIKSGNDLCSKINELAIIWRDVDHRIISSDQIFEVGFRDRFNQELEELSSRRSTYFNSLTDYIGAMETLSDCHMRTLSRKSIGSLLGLLMLAAMTYITFVFRDPRSVVSQSESDAPGTVIETKEKNLVPDFSDFEELELEKLSSEQIGEVTDAMSGMKCLLIEDDDDGRNFLLETLAEFNLECCAFEDNSELSPETLNQYDLLISDISLGPAVSNGIEFTRSIREEGCEIPVMLISAYLPSEAMKLNDSTGVTVGIKKPLEQSMLITGLAKMLDLQ